MPVKKTARLKLLVDSDCSPVIKYSHLRADTHHVFVIRCPTELLLLSTPERTAGIPCAAPYTHTGGTVTYWLFSTNCRRKNLHSIVYHLCIKLLLPGNEEKGTFKISQRSQEAARSKQWPLYGRDERITIITLSVYWISYPDFVKKH